jgi:hypothetical protein
MENNSALIQIDIFKEIGRTLNYTVLYLDIPL